MTISKEDRQLVDSILIDILALDFDETHQYLNQLYWPELNLVDDLGADSLDFLDILMEIEWEFQIDLDDENFQPKTVQEVYNKVEQLLST